MMPCTSLPGSARRKNSRAEPGAGTASSPPSRACLLLRSVPGALLSFDLDPLRRRRAISHASRVRRTGPLGLSRATGLLRISHGLRRVAVGLLLLCGGLRNAFLLCNGLRNAFLLLLVRRLRRIVVGLLLLCGALRNAFLLLFGRGLGVFREFL